MRFKSVIDREKIKTDEELLAYSEEYYNGLDAQAEVIIKSVGILKKVISNLLSEGAEESYQKICILLESKEYKMYSGFNFELICFNIAKKIYLLEKDDGRTLLEKIKDISDFYDLYMKMTYALRRIQLFGEDAADMTIQIIKKYELSVYALIVFLEDCIVGGKKKTAEIIARKCIGHYNETECLMLNKYFEISQ